MVYYLVHAYNKEVDEKHQTHLHPTYLTSYKMDGKQLGLQSGLYDALKFKTSEQAEVWRKKAEEIFPMKECRIVAIPSEVFGRVTPRFVVDGDFDPYCTFDILCESDKGHEKFVLELDEAERTGIKRFIKIYNANVPSWQRLDVKMNGKQL